MTILTSDEYLNLTLRQKKRYRFSKFFIAIGRFFKKIFVPIGRFFKKIFTAVGHFIAKIFIPVGRFFKIVFVPIGRFFVRIFRILRKVFCAKRLTKQEYKKLKKGQKFVYLHRRIIPNICRFFANIFLFIARTFYTKPLSGLEYVALPKPRKFRYKVARILPSIGKAIVNLIFKVGRFFKSVGLGIGHFFGGIVITFVEGDFKTRISYVVMGFGSIMRKQVFRGLLFFAFETIFIVYMIFSGSYFLSKLGSLGMYYEQQIMEGGVVTQEGVNSFNVLLYGVLTIFFIVALFYTWYLNIKQNRIGQLLEEDKKKLVSASDDLRALVDKDFHKTLLALPTLGIVIFTLLPIFFMILVAFTNYDKNHMPPNNLFGWVGFDNFNTLFNFSNGDSTFSMTFGQILLWTLVWAFFATFTNYFLGMLVAMLINKKGIKFKKVWRTILVLSIAIPQFISLLYVGQMFQADGIINNLITSCGGQAIDFWGDPWLARITVIVINIWIGIPYLMLVTTGILMNIPADLYESANIDGATPWQQYSKITLPYMLFVTGPYLLTSFTGNMNNFNVIYLLTGGGPSDIYMHQSANGSTDLLITWLFNLAVSDSDYKLAAVIGIMVFIVVAVISLIVYNILPSTRNEEEFQ